MIRHARALGVVLWMLGACNEVGTVGVVCLKDDCRPADSGYDAASGKAADDGVAMPGATVATAATAPPLVETEACRATPLTLARRELAIYMLVDFSWGMDIWWPPLLDGFTRFIDDPKSNGVNVALGFFGDACEAETYATPAVGFAALPAHREPLLTGFPTAPETFNSAFVPGLIGTHEYARKWSLEHAHYNVVVVLVTNTFAEDCERSLPEMMRIAQERVADPVSVPTWVLALNARDLDPIAQAGGSGKSLLVERLTSDNVVQRLNEMREAALPTDEFSCNIALPTADPIDLRRSSLRFALRDGGAHMIAPVADSADCDAAGGGFYQQAESKASLAVCASSCAALRDVVKVDLLSDCVAAGPQSANVSNSRCRTQERWPQYVRKRVS